MSYSSSLVEQLLTVIANSANWVGLLDEAGVELSNPDYSRIQINPPRGASPAWRPPLVSGANGRIETTDLIAWPQATVEWSPIAEVAVFDAQTGGNLLVREKLRTKRVTLTGERVTIPAQGLKVRLLE